jgi:Est1 DNA/RNA binding domain
MEIQRFDPRYPNLLLQPDSRPISQEQLASEVKSIYASLTMIETKCTHVDRAQASASPETEGDPNSKLAKDHWQALIGVHSFLEVLRRRLPESLDYMLASIYRMADPRDRETWAGVARFWYSKAADKSPSVGRLYHHLAILARPNALQQLYYYSWSLTYVQPFMSARESILTLLDPIPGRSRTSYSHSLPVDTSFIKAHGILFGKLSSEGFEEALASFLSQLDNYVGRVAAKWKEQGVYIAVTNCRPESDLLTYPLTRSPTRSPT